MKKVVQGLIALLKFISPPLAEALEEAVADGKIQAAEIDELVVELVDAAQKYAPAAAQNELQLVEDVARDVGKYMESQAAEEAEKPAES